MAHACNGSTGEVGGGRWEVQRHPQLHSKFKTSLGYIRHIQLQSYPDLLISSQELFINVTNELYRVYLTEVGFCFLGDQFKLHFKQQKLQPYLNMAYYILKHISLKIISKDFLLSVYVYLLLRKLSDIPSWSQICLSSQG